jgi:2-keto-4-pentenoate hydratase
MHLNAHDAARLLWTCRQSGTVINALPAALRPHDALAGHAIQVEIGLSD